jgi:hypothetical protein
MIYLRGHSLGLIASRLVRCSCMIPSSTLSCIPVKCDEHVPSMRIPISACVESKRSERDGGLLPSRDQQLFPEMFQAHRLHITYRGLW